VNLSHRMIGANQLKTQTGVYVIETVPVSGAEIDHLRVADIIVEFEGKPVATVDSLHKYLTEDFIGKSIQLGVLRGGRKQLISVTAGELT